MIKNEITGIVKTEEGYFDRVRATLEKLLPYEIPQIIKLDANANEIYLKWVKNSVK